MVPKVLERTKTVALSLSFVAKWSAFTYGDTLMSEGTDDLS